MCFTFCCHDTPSCNLTPNLFPECTLIVPDGRRGQFEGRNAQHFVSTVQDVHVETILLIVVIDVVKRRCKPQSPSSSSIFCLSSALF